jgi:hypothetical protein
MSSLVKSAILSLSLLAGGAVAAHAQSDNIAALPPGAAVTAHAPIGPSVPYPGPNPGKSWNAAGSQLGDEQTSPQYVGPSPGVGYYGRDENFDKSPN